MIYFLIIIAVIFIFSLWSFLEHKFIVTSEYIINSEEITFVVLSDIHNKGFRKSNQILLKKILEQRPDFVIIAGDMINKKKPCYHGEAFNIIKEISEHYPVYYANGNHEQYFEELTCSNSNVEKQVTLCESWNLYKEKLERLGVIFLNNKSIEIRRNDSKIIITGLSLSSDYYRNRNRIKLEQEAIIDYIGGRSSDGYQILIAHNPIYFHDYIEWGADLILAGHAHGGLIRIPIIGGIISPQFRLFPKYDAGRYSENNRHMIVSRGLGNHSCMPRIFNIPELVVVKMKGVL